MKKFRNIGLILGLIILISSNTKAQYYYTSYGYAHDWHLPKYIQYSIYDNYYGYDVAHVQRFYRQGHRNFNVLLHRKGYFVELRFDRHGHIYKTIRHRHHYPLMSHQCTHHCGYHHAYYKTYYPKYHHGYHHSKVYINTNHGYNKHHKHNHNKYYTNIHIQKQHKSLQNGGNNGKQKQYNNSQQRRTNNVIRNPQQTKTRNVEQRSAQSANRSRYLNGQKAPTRNKESARNLITYKNERGIRNR